MGLGGGVEQGESSSMTNGSMSNSKPMVREIPFIAVVENDLSAARKRGYSLARIYNFTQGNSENGSDVTMYDRNTV